jgi:hypothetical protein
MDADRSCDNKSSNIPHLGLFNMKQTNTNIVTLQSLPADLQLYIGKFLKTIYVQQHVPFLKTTNIPDYKHDIDDINCITLAGLLNNPDMWEHCLQMFGLDNKFSYSVAVSGNLRFLKLVVNKGCPVDKDTCSWAARGGGSLNMLKWLHSQGCPWDKETFFWAARHENSLETLFWLHSVGCPWDELTCMGAAQSGNLETLQWLHNQGCPWDEEYICEAAVYSENLEILQWLHTQGCPLNEYASRAAADSGNLMMLQWLHVHGCP